MVRLAGHGQPRTARHARRLTDVVDYRTASDIRRGQRASVGPLGNFRAVFRTYLSVHLCRWPATSALSGFPPHLSWNLVQARLQLVFRKDVSGSHVPLRCAILIRHALRMEVRVSRVRSADIVSVT